MYSSSGGTRQAFAARCRTLLRGLAASLSGLAVVFLSLAGAWYFGAALWWLFKHVWPEWTWMAGLGWGRGAGAWVQWLANRSPGATALIVAAALSLAARLVDPVRRRR